MILLPPCSLEFTNTAALSTSPALNPGDIYIYWPLFSGGSPTVYVWWVQLAFWKEIIWPWSILTERLNLSASVTHCFLTCVLPSIWGKSKHKPGSSYKYDFANLPLKIHAWCSVPTKWLEKWMGFPYVMLPGESALGTRYKFSCLSKLNWCWSPMHFLML